jgi:hypothetical protein
MTVADEAPTDTELEDDMKQHTKTLKRILGTATVATGLALTLVAGAASASEGDPAPPAGSGQRAEEICAHHDQIQHRIDTRQERLAGWHTRLDEAKARAEGAGRTELAARIQQRIERVEAAQARLAERETRLATFVAEHCAS